MTSLLGAMAMQNRGGIICGKTAVTAPHGLLATRAPFSEVPEAPLWPQTASHKPSCSLCPLSNLFFPGQVALATSSRLQSLSPVANSDWINLLVINFPAWLKPPKFDDLRENRQNHSLGSPTGQLNPGQWSLQGHTGVSPNPPWRNESIPLTIDSGSTAGAIGCPGPSWTSTVMSNTHDLEQLPSATEDHPALNNRHRLNLPLPRTVSQQHAPAFLLPQVFHFSLDSYQASGHWAEPQGII